MLESVTGGFAVLSPHTSCKLITMWKYNRYNNFTGAFFLIFQNNAVSNALKARACIAR